MISFLLPGAPGMNVLFFCLITRKQTFIRNIVIEDAAVEVNIETIHYLTKLLIQRNDFSCFHMNSFLSPGAPGMNVLFFYLITGKETFIRNIVLEDAAVEVDIETIHYLTKLLIQRNDFSCFHMNSFLSPGAPGMNVLFFTRLLEKKHSFKTLF